MVTRRGWLLLGAAVALLICGRILGIAELFGLAVAAAAVVVVARLHVGRGAGEVAVTARVSPSVAYVGESARLELQVENRGRRSSRGLLLRPLAYRGAQTPIDTGEIAVPTLLPGESARIVLALPTTHRGAYELSGLSVELEDPLGVAARRAAAPCQARLVVLPVLEQLEDLTPFSAFAGRDEALRSTAARLGSGLSSFRQYAEGDDLRLVHWKTTARIGELMVREGGDPEAPESLSVTVVLDCRRSVHTADTFETAVSTAASVLDTCSAIGAAVCLVTTGGTDTGFGTDDQHLEAALVELAIAEARTDTMSRGIFLGAAADEELGAGLLVAVTTTRSQPSEVDALLHVRRARTPVLALVGPAGELEKVEDSTGCVRIPANGSVRAAWLAAYGRPDVDAGAPVSARRLTASGAGGAHR